MANLGKSVKGKNKKKKAAPKTEGAVASKAKRLEESDYLKKLAAMQRKQLTDALNREREMTKWNLQKIQNTWRKIMRLAKVESLRKDIEVISQSHERDVDRKDAIIQMLDRDVEEAEEQYQIALRQHLRNIDRLIDIQDERLLALEDEFDKDLTIIDREFKEEREGIEGHHSIERHELVTLIETVQREESEKRTEAKTEHEQTKEIIRSRNLEKIHVLQSYLDNQIEELERSFESAHLTYLTNTDQRTQDFKDLTQSDQKNSADIDVKIRKIDKLQSSLQYWRAKMAANSRDCEARNATMRTEKEAISNHFQALKGKVGRHRDIQKQRLIALTKSARDTTKELTTKAELGERLLLLAERGRKLETDQEKVLFESGVTLEKTEPDATLPAELELPEGVGTEWSLLDNFYKKYNRALLDKLTLAREKERIAAENAELQSILKQYLEGISVTDTAVSKPNTLLMVNGETSLAAPLPVRMHAPTVVEGNHMVATGRVAGRRK